MQAEGAKLLQELSIPNIIEPQFNFSPRGTYLSTGELTAFTQKSQEGWDIQYTVSESHAIRFISWQEVLVFRPAEWGKGVVDKLKVESASMVSVSPGLNPSVAVFVGEKKVLPQASRSRPSPTHWGSKLLKDLLRG